MDKRIPVLQALAATEVVGAELEILRAHGFTPDQEAAAAAVRAELARATRAARGEEPSGNRWSMWWRGAQIETAYQRLHAARVSMISVYEAPELAAELPRAIARAQSCLHPDDPRRLGPEAFVGQDERSTRALLSRLLQDGYEASDQQYTRLRSFRNVVYLACAAVILVLGFTLLVVMRNPDLLPLCFRASTDGATGSGAAGDLVCPSATVADAPSANDIAIVALMGLVGGALSAVVNIRLLRGTSTPYDAPVALAVLKPPLGALTAVMGLVLVHGEFVPGLSNLDSQGQILAYALLFGVAQQMLTRLVDQKAQTLLNGLPSKDPDSSPGEPVTSQSAPLPPPTDSQNGTGDRDSGMGQADLVVPVVPEGVPGEFDEMTSEVQPNPEGDEDAQVQDDESAPIVDVLEKDHS